MKKNYIYNLILTIFNIVFPILSFPYASRVLGPVGIGRFQFVTSFAQYFILIANLGIPMYGTREIAKYKGDRAQQSKVFSELLIISLIMSLVLTAIYLVVIFTLNYFHADHSLYLTASISIFLSFTSIDWLYTGLEEFRMIAIRSVAVKFLSLLLLYLFVNTAHDVLIYLYIGIFSSAANNAYNLVTIRSKVKLTWKNLEMVKHIKSLLLIFGFSLATSMYTLLDVVMLGFLSDPRSVGLYAAAVKLTKIVIPFVISIGAVTMPKMSHYFATNNYPEIQKLLQKSLHFILFFSIPSFAGLALLSREFITLFSGTGFIEGALSMQILSLLPVLIGLGYFYGLQILIPSGNDKEMVICVLGGMVIAVALNFLLVPALKDVGASIANTITELMVTLFYVYFVNKRFSFSFDWSIAFKSVAASVVFIPAIFLVRMLHYGVPLTLTLSIILCGSAYLLIQWFGFKDHLINDMYGTLLAKLRPQSPARQGV